MAGKFRRSRGLAIATALVATAPVVITSPGAQARTTTAAQSNAVIVWDTHAQHAIHEVAGQTATTAGRSFAIVQGAVYDAVNAIAGAPYEPLLVAPRSRPGDSAPAAVATAAHRVLVWMFPAQADSLRARYDEYLAAIPDGRGKRGGIAVGEAAAAAMIDARRDDILSKDWRVGDEPGQYRPTAPDMPLGGAWVSTLKPFVVRDPDSYRTPGPPALRSHAYARELNEVKAVGSKNSKVRTKDQTESAEWWDDPRMVEWEIRRNVATTNRLSTLETARLFAMVDISAFDTLISCYKEKYNWSFWRPITAIRLANTDGNPATRADPSWTPLRTTAPSAEYPSGHACFTTAVMTGLRTYFGRDDVTFSAYSAVSGTTRRYTSLSKATIELGEARIWAGVHYRVASVDGTKLGLAVTRDVLDEAFGRRTH